MAFELRGWEGSYLVNGSGVELSDSLIKTRAKIKPGHKIVLRYYGKHGLVEMTYEAASGRDGEDCPDLRALRWLVSIEY